MKKICVVTTTRAEYGLLYWLMKAIDADAELRLQLLVTGMHLSPEFGSTWKMVEADGFVINEKVDMLLSGDSPAAIAKSIGLGTIGMADALARLQPDLLVLLGDRFEALAAAQAALVSRVPIAHLHGGEATEGLIDEAIRHSITKMSHLHFVAAEPYRHRVIQLGEQPDKVFNVGAPGLESIRRMERLDRQALEHRLSFKLDRPFFLVTYHPVTLQHESPENAMRSLFQALDQFPDQRVIFTYPNADTQGRRIIELINQYCETQPERCMAGSSLGHQVYLSLMHLSSAVVGNSSSGIIEAPSTGVPTINIGPRQKGRVQANSVIQCNEDPHSITAALTQAITPEFAIRSRACQSPYDSGDTAQRIVEVIRQTDLSGLLQKSFYNLAIQEGIN